MFLGNQRARRASELSIHYIIRNDVVHLPVALKLDSMNILDKTRGTVQSEDCFCNTKLGMAVATRGLSKLPGFSKSPEVTRQPDVGSGSVRDLCHLLLCSVSTARTELGKHDVFLL